MILPIIFIWMAICDKVDDWDIDYLKILAINNKTCISRYFNSNIFSFIYLRWFSRIRWSINSKWGIILSFCSLIYTGI